MLHFYNGVVDLRSRRLPFRWAFAEPVTLIPQESSACNEDQQTAKNQHWPLKQSIKSIFIKTILRKIDLMFGSV